MARVVRPGGKVVCLEIARPRSRLARVLRWWFDRIVPVIGRVAGQGDAYAYLVRSVQNYPAPERIAEIMREAGLVGHPLDRDVGRHRDDPRGHGAAPQGLTPRSPAAAGPGRDRDERRAQERDREDRKSP